jgi:hypothetical protein
MSILSKKKNVFEQIAILKTANEIVVNRDVLKNQSASLLNAKVNKDPFIFLIDLLTVVSGSDSVNKCIKNMISNVGSIDKKFKVKIKDEITHVIGGDKNNSDIPSFIKNGFKIHINKLDYNNDLFIRTNSPAYSLYLSEFQLKLQSAVQQPNVRITINNSLNGEYDNTSGNFTFYPTKPNLKYKDFLFDLIDTTKFINTSSIVNNSLNDLFNGKNLSKEQQILNQQVDIVLNNIIIEDEEDDSYFKFTDTESELINEKIATNYTYYNNVGSDQISSQLSNVELLDIVKKNGNTSSKFFTEIIKKLNTSVDQNDKQSMTNGFLSKFLMALKNNIIKNFVLSPQSVLIYSMANNVPSSDKLTPIADIRGNKNIIKCLISDITNSLMSGLYNMLKRDLLKVVAGVTSLYIQESSDKYKKIIQSLFKIV